MALTKITNAALIQEDWSNEVDIKAALKYGKYNLSLSKSGNNIVAAAGSYVDYNGTIYTCSSNETLYSSALSDGVYYLTSTGTPGSTLSFTVSTDSNITLDKTKNRLLNSSSNQVYAEIRVVDGVYSFSLMDGRNNNKIRKATYMGRDLEDVVADIVLRDNLFPLQWCAFHENVNDFVMSDIGICLKLRNASIAWSDDMLLWTNGTCSGVTLEDYYWTGGAYHNGVFAVVGYNGSTWKILYSTDGKVWTQGYTSSAGSQPTKMRWINDRFLAWGNGRLIYSTNGTSWTLTTIDSTTKDICYGAGLWVSSRPAAIYSSTDLSSWTSRLTHANNGVAFNGSVFCSIPSGSSSACVQYTSSNGTSWTAPSNATWLNQAHFYSSSTEWYPMQNIVGGDGYFIASCSEDTPTLAYHYYLIYSTDGLNWGALHTHGYVTDEGPTDYYGTGRTESLRFNDHMLYGWGSTAYYGSMKPMIYSPAFFVHKYRSSK